MAQADLTNYIGAARKKGHSELKIEQDLVAAGWDARSVAKALGVSSDLVVPAPPAGAGPAPRAVVQTLSTRGLEYIIMFIALAVLATSLGSLLHSWVNNLFGTTDAALGGASDTPLGTSGIIVALPIFAWLFVRLRHAERADPTVRVDPSRRRAVQLTLIVTFLIGLGNVIYFVYSLMSGPNTDTYMDYNAYGSQVSSSILGNFVHLAVTLLIAGGIFWYYWRDAHLEP